MPLKLVYDENDKTHPSHITGMFSLKSEIICLKLS